MPDFPFDLSKLDLSSVMDMAKNLKDKMREMEESLARVEVETSVGGGMVTVRANAKGDILKVTIDPELVDMKDKAMIENLVASGVNQALSEARKKREEEMQKMTGGMGLPNIPGMFG